MVLRPAELRPSPQGVPGSAPARNRDVYLLSREWPGGLVRASSEDPCETCSEKCRPTAFHWRFHPQPATIQIRVEEEVKLRLEKYAEFINSSPAYVVTEALKLLFKKDEEFKSWLGQHTNNDNLNQIEGASLTEIAKKA